MNKMTNNKLIAIAEPFLVRHGISIEVKTNNTDKSSAVNPPMLICTAEDGTKAIVIVRFNTANQSIPLDGLGKTKAAKSIALKAKNLASLCNLTKVRFDVLHISPWCGDDNYSFTHIYNISI